MEIEILPYFGGNRCIYESLSYIMFSFKATKVLCLETAASQIFCTLTRQPANSISVKREKIWRWKITWIKINGNVWEIHLRCKTSRANCIMSRIRSPTEVKIKKWYDCDFFYRTNYNRVVAKMKGRHLHKYNNRLGATIRRLTGISKRWTIQRAMAATIHVRLLLYRKPLTKRIWSTEADRRWGSRRQLA